jgi:hypothetical protein
MRLHFCKTIFKLQLTIKPLFMKQKFLLFVLFITLLQLNSFAQQRAIEIPSSLPLIAEDGIISITASDNIDVILMPEGPADAGAKASAAVIRKLRVSLVDGNLFLSAAQKLSPGERLPVYVWVKDLEMLTLDGNAHAVSTGILRTRYLHISASHDAMISLKSQGKVWFDASAKYNVKTENGYFFVNAL